MFEIIFIFVLGLSYLLYKAKANKKKLIQIKCPECSELMNFEAGNFKKGNDNHIRCQFCNCSISYNLINVSGYAGGQMGVKINGKTYPF